RGHHRRGEGEVQPGHEARADDADQRDDGQDGGDHDAPSRSSDTTSSKRVGDVLGWVRPPCGVIVPDEIASRISTCRAAVSGEKPACTSAAAISAPGSWTYSRSGRPIAAPRIRAASG